MENKNAGFIVRLFALLTDSLLEILIFVIGLYFFVSVLSVNNFVTSSLNLISYIIGFFLLFGIVKLVYSIYFISHFGGTIGKLIFNLKIVDNNTDKLISSKKAFYRLFIGYIFSAQFIGWGFLRVIKKSDKLAWHDELFNTKVVSKGSKLSGIVIFIGLLLVIGFLSYKIFIQLENSSYTQYVTKIIQPLTPRKIIDQKIRDDINKKNDTIGTY